MVTRSPAVVRDNTAPRVSKCDQCGKQLVAGARGPLPRRCRDCRASSDVLYRITTARKTAEAAGATADVVDPLRAAETAAQGWTRYGE